jgi:hypothetical protein
MPDLIHIVYMSFSSKALSETELNGFLATIRRKNQTQNITGLLLYSDGAFIQVIEGERDIIHHTFKLIAQDPRHSSIVKLIEEPISKRNFPSWSMGFRQLEDSNKASIVGYSDFMQNDKSKFDTIECAESVRHLLSSFKKHT